MDFKVYKTFVLVDTNIILHDAQYIFNYINNDTLLIIPDVVIDEIDSKKNGFDEINFQAREFGRLLDEATVVSNDTNDLLNFTLLNVKDLNILIIENKELNTNSVTQITPKNVIADRLILDTITKLKTNFDINVKFLSLDTMAKVRAISKTIEIENYNNKNKVYEFHKIIDDKSNNIKTLQDIKDHTQNIYSYTVKADYDTLYMVQDDKLVKIKEKYVRDQDVNPLNKEQLLLASAIVDPYYNVIVSNSLAGSGKSLITISSAIKLVEEKKYNNIIYIRNSIESLDKGEDIGYLSGNEEKFKIYNYPLEDALKYIINLRAKKEAKKSSKKNNDKKAYTEELIPHNINTSYEKEQYLLNNIMKEYGISTRWPGSLRGSTLTESVIIIDEAQNISNKTMKTIMTRIDKTCKVIILGSLNQIDNFYINKYTSSLTTLIDASYNKQNINMFVISLEKVLRGPITEFAENLF